MKLNALTAGTAALCVLPMLVQPTFAGTKTQTCEYQNNNITTCEPQVEINASATTTFAAECTGESAVVANNYLNNPNGVDCSLTNSKLEFHCTNWNTKKQHFTQRIQCRPTS